MHDDDYFKGNIFNEYFSSVFTVDNGKISDPGNIEIKVCQQKFSVKFTHKMKFLQH